MSTGKKKIKIELEDAEGGKYNLSLEGNLSKDKIQKVLQLVESLNISREDSSNNSSSSYDEHTILDKKFTKQNLSNNSIDSKIWTLIENNFTYSSFTSSNIAESYEELYGEQLQLSLVSTYLSRYYEKHKLIRSKRGKEWIYKLLRIQKNISSTGDDMASLQPTPITHSQSSNAQTENEFLKQNALTTVYDLHL